MKTFSELFARLNKSIQISLQGEVLNEVNDMQYKNIYKYVYHVYQPKAYSRKMDTGGLSDKGNMIFDEDAIKSNNLIARSTRDAINEDYGNLVDVAHIVQTGKGYTRSFPYRGIPRNYTKVTKSQLSKGKNHIKALIRGMKKEGWKVK